MKLSKEFLTFATVGVLNTGLDFAMFFLAIAMTGADKVTANVIAWFVAVQFSYVLNARLTFRKPRECLNIIALAKFMLSGIVGLIVATFTLLVLSEHTGLIIAKLVSIGIGLVLNFTLAKHFAFSG